MSVYRVAVCEDEAGAGEQLAELCRDIFETWGVEAELSLFPTADGLDAAWEGFELYLLDIQMEGTDGLELARRLYERGVRDRVVFITGSAEYALAGYSVHPLDYLLKPVDREALEQALRRAWERRRPRTLLFRSGGRTAAVPAEEVRYLESRNHAVTVHLSGSELPLATSLMEAERHTPSEDPQELSRQPRLGGRDGPERAAIARRGAPSRQPRLLRALPERARPLPEPIKKPGKIPGF